MKYEIKNRWTDTVIYSGDYSSLRECVIDAVIKKTDLRYSDLRYSNLSYSDLSYSDLSYSDLRGSDLRYSDLRGSDLRYSDLRGSDLRGSDLRGSHLRGSDLSGSNLSGSNLRGFKSDLWEVLLHAKKEIPALKKAILEGRVNGSYYEGDCACLVGTIAKVRKCDYKAIEGIKPDSSRPAEVWFTGITEGADPKENQFAKLALEWIEELETLIKA